MAGYTKLFSNILTSSIWMEEKATRILWITMLAMADRGGEVMASVPGLAHTANITRQECVDGLRVLMEPDHDSRTTDNDGRRIAEIDGGWMVLNHHIYRAKLSNDPKTAADRERKRRERNRKEIECDVTEGHAMSRDPVSVSASEDVSVSEKKNEKPKTFKQWTADEFLDECNRVHEAEHILPTDEEGNRFYLYWTEPDARGRPKFAKQQTWDTARRMVTWRDNQERFGRKVA